MSTSCSRVSTGTGSLLLLKIELPVTDQPQTLPESLGHANFALSNICSSVSRMTTSSSVLTGPPPVGPLLAEPPPPPPPPPPPLATDPLYADEAAFVAEFEAMAAAGHADEPPPDPGDDVDWFDCVVPPEESAGFGQVSRVDRLEWELWASTDRDEAEAVLLAERAPAWFGVPPGGELATALEGVRCSTESPVALVEIMKAAARMTAWAESVRVAAMAAFYRRRRGEVAEAEAAGFDRYVDERTGWRMDPMRGAAAEIAAALRLSPNTVISHIDNALRLTRDLRDTFSALRCGAITNSKALSILDATEHLPVTAQQQVEAKVLRRAPMQTQRQLRASLRRAVAKVDKRNQAKKHRDAVRERACRKQQLPNGMAGIWITNRADKIEAMWTAVQSLAGMAKTPGDERTAEQRRADAVVDVFGHILANGTDWLGRSLPNQQRRRPHIEITVPFSTLLGLGGLDPAADPPAELTGYGPIPAEMARQIAAEGTWRRLLTDPVTGAVLEAATKRHDPPAQVSETLLTRHPVCDWVGCDRPARECDRDHGTKYRYTGRTVLWDVRNYCEYHHPLKDAENQRWSWRVENMPDGTTKFTTPTGHVYRTRPPARGPILGTAAPSAEGNPAADGDKDVPPF